LQLRGMSGAQIAREMRRDLEADISAALANLARELLDVLHFADDPKRLRVNEAIDKLPALDGAILIQDHRGHVFHVVVERVTKRDHFDQWREEHEKERQRIPDDRDEFLEQDGAKASEGCALHEIGDELATDKHGLSRMG
jgi:hypothetical protein